MLIKFICQVSMVLVLPLNFSDLTLFDVSDESRSNPFEEREGMVRISPTSSVIISTTH